MAGGVFGWRCRRRARIMIDVMTPTPRDMVPNGSRRSPWHDYSRHAVYLVTLIRGPQTNPFSEFVFDSESGRRTLDLNLLPEGEHVDDAIQVIEKSFEGVEILMYEILPDYAIFVVHNASRDALTLQQLIFWIKQEANRRYINRITEICEPDPEGDYLTSLFAGGYEDRIARRKSDVDRFVAHVEKAAAHYDYHFRHPGFRRRFVITSKDGRNFEGFGNPLLLDDPQISAVRVSSRFSSEELLKRKSDWFRTTLNGGVLVSPFVSGAEYKVRRWALENGGRLIILKHNGFGPSFSLEPELASAIDSGRVLLLAPTNYDPNLSRPGRELCMAMNATAEQIARHGFIAGSEA